MGDDLRQKLTGWGKVVWGDKSYKKIRYMVILEKEDPINEEPDIYGTVDDQDGDKLDIPQFICSQEEIILNLEDSRYLKIVFLDESNEFEVDGGIRSR